MMNFSQKTGGEKVFYSGNPGIQNGSTIQEVGLVGVFL